MNRRTGLKIELPSTRPEPVRLGRIGIIAVVGFGIGIAWPHLAGVRLVPRLPSESSSAARELTGAPEDPGEAEAPKAAPEKPATPAPEEPKIQPPVIGEPQILGCRAKGGRRVPDSDCDNVDFDRVARPRLQALEGCEGWARLTGVLSVGFDLDFATERISKLTSGKSTTLPENDASLLLDCYRRAFQNLSLVGIPHQNEKYSVYYRVELKGAPVAEASSESEVQPITPASGRATVSWEVALVRAAPKRDGEVLARILSGTRVVVTGRSGDWYRVQFDAKGSEGWVFRSSIGM
jgi:hypothetical protein